MKSMLVLIFAGITSSVFALTQTIEGITWYYYEDKDGVILENPSTRTMVPNESNSPLPAHSGTLPKVLRLPSMIDGMPVVGIGVGAIKIPDDSDVTAVIVPSTVLRIATNGSSFFSRASLRDHNYYDTWRGWWVYPIKNTVNIMFEGLKPATTISSSWSAGGRECSCTGRFNYSQGNGCMAVEGCEDWVEGETWLMGAVDYGAAKVNFAPADGVLAEDRKVVLTSANDTAKIYYTIDGSEPTTNQTANCFLYEGPFSITHRVQVKALAYVAEYPYQVVYSNEYAFGQAVEPNISAEENVFNWAGNIVTLSCETDSVEIHYTLDGSEPTEKSALYTGPFAIDDTTTVKAKAFKEDWFDSETATATFTREWYTVERPVIEPSGITFDNVSQAVSISCETEGATILYTVDGSDPAVNGREYKHPFGIYQSCSVRAIAIKDDWKDSEEATATFTRSESLSEAANFYGYTMETDDSHPWTVVTDVSHDGVSSVQSGTIGNNETTWLQSSIKKSGKVSFWWRAACEEADEEEGDDGYYDYGAFLVDDVVVARIAGHDGEWHYVSHEIVGGGKHTLKWEYRKDGATSYAPDCVWIDQVQWIPADDSGYTLTTPEPVPYLWLTKYGFDGKDVDYESAANALSGKTQGGKATTIWEEFVAGTNPTNETSVLTAKIDIQDGVPVVTWEPNLNTNSIERLYKVYGKETLSSTEEWTYPTNSLHRFFKVTVEMP